MASLYRHLIIFTFSFVFLVFFNNDAEARFPEKPITILVGHGAGGSTDIIARTFAFFLSKYINSPVVVRNMKGAGGSIAMKHTFQADPDGYTLQMVVVPSYLTRQLVRRPDWDIIKFATIYGIAGGDSNGLIVGKDSKIKSFEDFLQRSQNETITVSGTSLGSNSWLFTILLRERAGAKFVYVPFDSGNEATMSVVGGHVNAAAANTINFPSLIKEGKISVLAVASKKRLVYLPNVPTFSELGFANIVTVTRQILMGPPNLPKDVVMRLAEASEKAVSDPEFLDRSMKQGFTVDPMNAEEVVQEVDLIYNDIEDLLNKAGELKSN